MVRLSRQIQFVGNRYKNARMISNCASVIGNEKRNSLRIATYACQVLGIFVIIVACIINLSIGSDKESLWSSLLGSAIGYLLPSPKLSKKDDPFLSNPSLKFIDAVLPEQRCDTLHDETENYERVDGGMGSGTNGDIVSEIVVKRA